MQGDKNMNSNEPQVPTEPKSIYNPSKEDFVFQYAFNEEAPKQYTIHAGEIETYPEYLFNHAMKHLAPKILLERGVTTNYEADLQEVIRELTIEL